MRNVIERFKINIDEYPKCKKLYEKLGNDEIFKSTHPNAQPNAGEDPVATMK